MTWGGWFCSTPGPPRTLLPHSVACCHPALLLATGLQKPRLRLQLKEMDARTLLIGHSIKGHGGPPLLWGPALWVSPSPSSHTHTHIQHTHTELSPASATWGISRACKQANHSLPFSLSFSLSFSHTGTHTTAPEWLTNVRMACMGFLRKLFINWTG